MRLDEGRRGRTPLGVTVQGAITGAIVIRTYGTHKIDTFTRVYQQYSVLFTVGHPVLTAVGRRRRRRREKSLLLFSRV